MAVHCFCESPLGASVDSATGDLELVPVGHRIRDSFEYALLLLYRSDIFDGVLQHVQISSLCKETDEQDHVEKMI